MKDAVSLPGFVEARAGKDETYRLVPSGNHRNQQRVQMAPAPPSQPGTTCPRCKGKLRAWVQTFPTEFYVQWTEQAVKALLDKYQPGQFTEPVVVCLWVLGGRGFLESRDWDNVQKCVGDALVKADVLPRRLDSKKQEQAGDDDVRSIKGWRTHYLTRDEHVKLTSGASGRAEIVKARLYVRLVPASMVDPFGI